MGVLDRVHRGAPVDVTKLTKGERLAQLNRSRTGFPLSVKHRAALSTGHLGKKYAKRKYFPRPWQRGAVPWLLTPAARQKAAASMRGKTWSVSEHGVQNMVRASHRQWKKRTSIEITVAAVLDVLTVPYQSQLQIGRYVADFYVPSYNLIIEADGDYWHGTEQAKAKDKIRDEYFFDHGYRILRLSGKLIKNGGASPLIERAFVEVA